MSCSAIESATYSIYDAACGTGGILSIAEQDISEVGVAAGKQLKIDLYGQELQPETYATRKRSADARYLRAYR